MGGPAADNGSNLKFRKAAEHQWYDEDDRVAMILNVVLHLLEGTWDNVWP